MTVDGKRNRGRPKLRWRDLVKEDMARNQMTTEMAEDRKHYIHMYPYDGEISDENSEHANHSQVTANFHKF